MKIFWFGKKREMGRERFVEEMRKKVLSAEVTCENLRWMADCIRYDFERFLKDPIYVEIAGKSYILVDVRVEEIEVVHSISGEKFVLPASMDYIQAISDKFFSYMYERKLFDSSMQKNEFA